MDIKSPLDEVGSRELSVGSKRTDASAFSLLPAPNSLRVGAQRFQQQVVATPADGEIGDPEPFIRGVGVAAMLGEGKADGVGAEDLLEYRGDRHGATRAHVDRLAPVELFQNL